MPRRRNRAAFHRAQQHRGTQQPIRRPVKTGRPPAAEPVWDRSLTRTPLGIYLRNHEAAAHAGLALFRRATRAQQHQPWAAALEQLSRDVDADLQSLRQLLTRWHIKPDRRLEIILRIGEFIGRAKPNGRLLRRSPLSDLIEIEAMLDAVHAKQRGWSALNAAGGDGNDVTADINGLDQQAKNQQRRLEEIHREAAAQVLR